MSKLFIVKGGDWSLDIEVEADFSEIHEEMAFEAMSRAVDLICDDSVGLSYSRSYDFGPYMIAYTEDGKSSHTVLTSDVLDNTGHRALADMFRKKMEEDQNEPD